MLLYTASLFNNKPLQDVTRLFNCVESNSRLGLFAVIG